MEEQIRNPLFRKTIKMLKMQKKQQKKKARLGFNIVEKCENKARLRFNWNLILLKMQK